MAYKVSFPTTTCVSCHCVNGGRPCDICVHFNFSCKGTCACCVESRRATPSTSRGQGTSSITKEGPQSVCAQCDCLKSSMPCRKCVRANMKCTGTCPCCVRSQEKILNPYAKNYYDPICPRCTRTPGEGSCHFCRKTAEENAANLARLKAKKRRRPKPAILQHKKKELCNTSTDQAINVKQPAVSKVENLIKRKEYKLLNQRYIIEEYCLHCQCKRGSEPCMTCRSSTCYGDCVCCRYNKLLIGGEQLLENPFEITTHTEGQMERRIVFEDPTDDDGLASTSGTSVDNSSKPNVKCEKCDCFRNFAPCEDCAENYLGCFFSGDSTICLCCTIIMISLQLKGYKKFF